jgi:hypothetical protein
MQSFTGLLFKWPIIYRKRERADGAGLEEIGRGKM